MHSYISHDTCTSIKRISKAPDASAAWAILILHFDKKTVPAKLAAIHAISSFLPGLKADVRVSFDQHAKNRIQLMTAFGPSINTEELANMFFLNSLPGYQFQTEFHKSTAKLDFEKFQLDVENAYDHASVGPQSNMSASIDSCTKCNNSAYVDGGVCRKCNPCQKCINDMLRYTWPLVNSAKCVRSQDTKGFTRKRSNDE